MLVRTRGNILQRICQGISKDLQYGTMKLEQVKVLIDKVPHSVRGGLGKSLDRNIWPEKPHLYMPLLYFTQFSQKPFAI